MVVILGFNEKTGKCSIFLLLTNNVIRSLKSYYVCHTITHTFKLFS